MSAERFPRCRVRRNAANRLCLEFMRKGVQIAFFFEGEEVAGLLEALEAANNEPGSVHDVAWDDATRDDN